MAQDTETIKQIINGGRDFIMDQFEWGLFVFTLVGWCMVSIAILMLLFTLWHRFNSVLVAIKVIGLKEEVRENKKRKDDEPLEYILYTPEFEIISGEFIGTTCFSATASSNNDHNIGEKIDGYYSAKTGHIESRKSIKTSYMISVMVGLIGLSLCYGLPYLMRHSLIS